MLTKVIGTRLLALAAVALFWSLAAGQETPLGPGEEAVDGRVAEVNEERRTISIDVEGPLETEEGAEWMTFHIPEDAEIVLEGVNLDHVRTLDDLRVGLTVRVVYEEGENGEMTLRRLEG